MTRGFRVKLCVLLESWLRRLYPYSHLVGRGSHDHFSWVKDASGRKWTHPRHDIIQGTIEGTRIYGPAPFDFLSRQPANQRSGWIMLSGPDSSTAEPNARCSWCRPHLEGVPCVTECAHAKGNNSQTRGRVR